MAFDGILEKVDPDADSDIFRFESFVRWIEDQPPETTYRYLDIHDCILCRYGRAMGLDVKAAGQMDIWLNTPTPAVYERRSIPGAQYVTPPPGREGTSTYGEALERARAYQVMEARRAAA